jgi:MFS family permease
VSTPEPPRPGRVVAAAAILVTAPRLALAFLAADGIAVPPGVRVALLAVTSVATAIALTGGAAYLSLVIGREVRGRSALVAFWAASILCSSALIAPGIVAGLPASALAGVLSGRAQQWVWSICAVAAVDLIAAGAMRADARQTAARAEAQAALDAAARELEQQRDAARADLRAARREIERLRAAAPIAPAAAGPAAPASALVPAAAAASAAGALTCSRCGATGFPSQTAFAGHRRWCRQGDAAPAREALPATPSREAHAAREASAPGPAAE